MFEFFVVICQLLGDLVRWTLVYDGLAGLSGKVCLLLQFVAGHDDISTFLVKSFALDMLVSLIQNIVVEFFVSKVSMRYISFLVVSHSINYTTCIFISPKSMINFVLQIFFMLLLKSWRQSLSNWNLNGLQLLILWSHKLFLGGLKLILILSDEVIHALRLR